MEDRLTTGWPRRQALLCAPAFLASQVVLLLYVLLPGPVVVLWPRSRLHGGWMDLCPLRPGQAAPSVRLAGEDGKWRSLASVRRGPTALILSNSCSACTLRSLSVWEGVQRRHPRLSLLLAAPMPVSEMKSIRRILQSSGLRVTVFSSLGSAVEQVYRPTFTPRAFYIDQGGYIRYVQQPEDGGTEAARQVSRLLSGMAMARQEGASR